MERFQLDLDLETKKFMKIQIDQITQALRSMSHQEPWASKMMYLTVCVTCWRAGVDSAWE
jgi:hypothetical protein